MAQQGLVQNMEQDKLRRELFKLLSQGVNKEGDGECNLIQHEMVSFGDATCERVGLYY